MTNAQNTKDQPHSTKPLTTPGCAKNISKGVAPAKSDVHSSSIVPGAASNDKLSRLVKVHVPGYGDMYRLPTDEEEKNQTSGHAATVTGLQGKTSGTSSIPNSTVVDPGAGLVAATKSVDSAPVISKGTRGRGKSSDGGRGKSRGRSGTGKSAGRGSGKKKGEEGSKLGEDGKTKEKARPKLTKEQQLFLVDFWEDNYELYEVSKGKQFPVKAAAALNAKYFSEDKNVREITSDEVKRYVTKTYDEFKKIVDQQRATGWGMNEPDPSGNNLPLYLERKLPNFNRLYRFLMTKVSVNPKVLMSTAINEDGSTVVELKAGEGADGRKTPRANRDVVASDTVEKDVADTGARKKKSAPSGASVLDEEVMDLNESGEEDEIKAGMGVRRALDVGDENHSESESRGDGDLSSGLEPVVKKRKIQGGASSKGKGSAPKKGSSRIGGSSSKLKSSKPAGSSAQRNEPAKVEEQKPTPVVGGSGAAGGGVKSGRDLSNRKSQYADALAKQMAEHNEGNKAGDATVDKLLAGIVAKTAMENKLLEQELANSAKESAPVQDESVKLDAELKEREWRLKVIKDKHAMKLDKVKLLLQMKAAPELVQSALKEVDELTELLGNDGEIKFSS